MGRIIMVGAMKGGVGKTVTVFNLAYLLRKKGKTVLAVDLDPQSQYDDMLRTGRGGRKHRGSDDAGYRR